MALKSYLFAGNQALEQCAVRDASHILRGAKGVHVGKIQAALAALDDAVIDPAEWRGRMYGASTERAVLAFKQKRKIINRSYQSKEDAIVGKMTVAALADMRGAGGFIASGADDPPAIVAGSNRQRIAAPVAANAEKPKLMVGVGSGRGEGGASVLAGVNYQMVPLRGTRTITAMTYGARTRLRVPANVTVAIDGTPATPVDSVVTIPAGPGVRDITVTGVSAGTGVLMLRADGESWEEVLARDALLSVKGAISVHARAVFVTDARKNRSQYSESDVQTAMASLTRFFKSWCNIDVTYHGSMPFAVDEDLGDPFDAGQRVAAEMGSDAVFHFAGGKQRVFDNEFDRLKGNRSKVVYFMWRLKGERTVAVTYHDRVFMQNYGDDQKKLIIALAHEMCHAMGAHEHSTQIGNLMYEVIEGMGPTMDFVDIDLCNPG
ncbi:MAG: hypothetical protein EOP19_16750 [Hyphomicrobiales bacterium]|nr:MAG: hypothetical protein EOP19_16750 [Hyphomicrobiales bacterium]